MTMSFYPSLIYWPEVLCRDRSITFELMARTITGGRSLSGPQQVGRIDGGGIWSATLSDVQVSTPTHVRAWRALAARLDSGVTAIVMPFRDEQFAPWPLVGGIALTSSMATASDDSTPDDDTEYVGTCITATLAAGAELRATELTVTVSVGSALQGGEHFSIEHETYSHRLYRVAKVLEGDGVTTLQIRPPLREATSAGKRLSFDTPKCVMQLATPSAMDLALDLRTYGRSSPKFVEAFPPWE